MRCRHGSRRKAFRCPEVVVPESMVSSGQILLLFATSCTVYSHPKDVHPYFHLTMQLAS